MHPTQKPNLQQLLHNGVSLSTAENDFRRLHGKTTLGAPNLSHYIDFLGSRI